MPEAVAINAEHIRDARDAIGRAEESNSLEAVEEARLRLVS